MHFNHRICQNQNSVASKFIHQYGYIVVPVPSFKLCSNPFNMNPKTGFNIKSKDQGKGAKMKAFPIFNFPQLKNIPQLPIMPWSWLQQQPMCDLLYEERRTVSFCIHRLLETSPVQHGTTSPRRPTTRHHQELPEKKESETNVTQYKTKYN